eukprot:m51a1_g11972 putative camk camk1 protein variant 1 (572) ;mRNA; r:830064-832862
MASLSAQERKLSNSAHISVPAPLPRTALSAAAAAAEDDLGSAAPQRLDKVLERLKFIQFSSTSNAPTESKKKRRMMSVIEQTEVPTIALDSFNKDYEVVRPLGEGATCKVVLGKNRNTGELVAIKMIPKKHIEDRAEFSLIAKEIHYLKQLSHPSIIRYHDVFFTSECLIIVLEYATGHELFEEILSRRTFSEREAAMVMHKILNALAYLHTRGIVHADLKPENLMLGDTVIADNLTVKLIDFGLAHTGASSDPKSTAGRGTLGYRAPELWKGEIGTPATDMWAMGVILFVMLYGRPPFVSDPDSLQDEGLLMNAPFWFLFNEETEFLRTSIVSASFEFPKEPAISADARDLLSRMLRANPEDRITATQSLRHPWLLLEFVPPDSPRMNMSRMQSRLVHLVQTRPPRILLTESKSLSPPAKVHLHRPSAEMRPAKPTPASGPGAKSDVAVATVKSPEKTGSPPVIQSTPPSKVQVPRLSLDNKSQPSEPDTKAWRSPQHGSPRSTTGSPKPLATSHRSPRLVPLEDPRTPDETKSSPSKVEWPPRQSRSPGMGDPATRSPPAGGSQQQQPK